MITVVAVVERNEIMDLSCIYHCVVKFGGYVFITLEIKRSNLGKRLSMQFVFHLLSFLKTEEYILSLLYAWEDFN